jgi:hypothetical protein
MSNDHGEFDGTPTKSKTTGTVGNFAHGSRETPATSVSSMGADRSEKARGHNADTHVTGESHSSIVHLSIATGPDTEPEIGRETVRSQVARIAGCT